MRGSPNPDGERSSYPTKLVMLIVSGVVLFAVVGGGVVFLLVWSKDAAFTIAEHKWVREVTVEQLVALDESEWCDRMPPDATKVARQREIRSTRRTRDGETCENVRVKRGDGTTETRRECDTRWREEPVYDDRCSFTVNRWRAARVASATGPRKEEPRWPAVTLEKVGQGLGSEREGPRRERFVVLIRDAKKATIECDLERAHWAVLPVEGKLRGEVAALTGKVDCASLKAP